MLKSCSSSFDIVFYLATRRNSELSYETLWSHCAIRMAEGLTLKLRKKEVAHVLQIGAAGYTVT